MDVSAKLNALLPNLPIKGEPNNAVVPKKVSYSKTTAVVIPKIQKIDAPTPLHTAENAYDAVVKGAPNTITDKYVKIGNAMIPGDFFIPRSHSLTPAPRRTNSSLKPTPNAKVQAAIKINKSRELLQEGDEKQSSFKFEQYLSEEKKSEYELIVRDFNSYRVQRGLTAVNNDKDVKMLCLLNALNLTVGNINILEPEFIDAVLLCRFQEYNEKNRRVIFYGQTVPATLDYVKNNNLFGALKVKYNEYEKTAQFTYADVTTFDVPTAYGFLLNLFINRMNIPIRGKHKAADIQLRESTPQRTVLVAANHHLGDSEEEFFKLMGWETFNKLLSMRLAPIASDLKEFYTRIFSVSSTEVVLSGAAPKAEVKAEAPIEINIDEVKDLLRAADRKIDEVNAYVQDIDQKLARIFAAREGREVRGETVAAERLTPDIQALQEALQEANERRREIFEQREFLVQQLDEWPLNQDRKRISQREFDDLADTVQLLEGKSAALGITINDLQTRIEEKERAIAQKQNEIEQKQQELNALAEQYKDSIPKAQAEMEFAKIAQDIEREMKEKVALTVENAHLKSLLKDTALQQKQTPGTPGAKSSQINPKATPPPTSPRTQTSQIRQPSPVRTASKSPITMSPLSKVPKDDEKEVEEKEVGLKPIVTVVQAQPVLPPVTRPKDSEHREYSKIPDPYSALFIHEQDLKIVTQNNAGTNEDAKKTYEALVKENQNKPYPELLSAIYKGSAAYTERTEKARKVTGDRASTAKAHIALRALQNKSVISFRDYLELTHPGEKYEYNDVANLLENMPASAATSKLDPSAAPQSSSSTVQGSGFIKGGSLSANELAKFHDIIFIKKLQKIRDNVFMFTF